MKHVLLALVAVLGLASRSSAQLVEDYRFKGDVVDKQGKPIPEVRIIFRNVASGQRIVFKTEKDGSFDRRLIPHGVYEVAFEKEGYEAVTQNFDWQETSAGTIEREGHIVLESAQERRERELQDNRVQLGKKAAKLYEQAYAALTSGDCPGASAKAREILETGAGGFEYAVRFVIARCHNQNNELDAAAAEYRKVLELKPELFEAQFDLASVLQRQGNEAASLEAYRKAAELNPNDAEVHYATGAILFRADRADEARPHLEHAVELDPSHAQAHKALALALLAGEQKDLAKVRQLLERYLELSPGAADNQQIQALLKELGQG